MKNQLEGYTKRSERHENIDGVGELNVGIGTLGFAVYFWLQVTTPDGSAWNQWYTFYGLLGLLGLVLYLGTKVIRTNVTYPRTGYVKSRQDRIPWLGFLVAVLLLAVASVIGPRHVIASVTVLTMIVPAAYAYGVARVDGRKWPVVGVMVLGAVAISMIPADVIRSAFGSCAAPRLANVVDIFARFWLSFMFFAVTMAVSGGLTLYRYIQQTKPRASGTE